MQTIKTKNIMDVYIHKNIIKNSLIKDIIDLILRNKEGLFIMFNLNSYHNG